MRLPQYPAGHIPFIPIISGTKFLCSACQKLGSFTEKTSQGNSPICDNCIYEYKEKQKKKDNLIK